MKTISFASKNNFIVKHKSGKHFSKDLELFKKHFPTHRLNNELARANSFTFDRLDGQMLYALLEKTSQEEILANREEKLNEDTNEAPNAETTTDPVVENPPADEKMKALEEKAFNKKKASKKSSKQ